MKPLGELNHYEILEVAPDAPREEIERAWRLARATYAEGSLAVYSVYGDDEVAAIRERIDLAWQVLADPDARREYDASLPREDEGAEIPMEIALAFEPVDSPLPPTPEFADYPEFAELEELDENGSDFNGARLRRSRLHRGLEIEQIAQVTKINPTYLRFIEDERYDDLPAPVYVRGFVSAYARCLGLDADTAAGSYMERFQAAQVVEPQRGRRSR